MLQTKDDRSLGELFSELTQGMSTLVRQEVQLAKTEISEKVSNIVKNVALLLAGGVFALVGFQALVAAAIIGLARVLPGWLAALIVALVLLVVAGILAMKGLATLKKQSPMPQQTAETIKEDVQWAKQQVK